MPISKNIKKLLVTGAAVIMAASAGAASASNVDVNAKYIHTYRIYYHHTRKGARRYRNNKRKNHKRVRRSKKHARKRNWSVKPSDLALIKRNSTKSRTLILPKSYYGNYFDGVPGKKGIYSFIHLAKHGAFTMANPESDTGTQRVYYFPGFGVEPGKAPYYNKHDGFNTEFINTVISPLSIQRVDNKMIAHEYMGQTHVLKPVSERQGIHYFEKYNRYQMNEGESTSDY